MDWILGTSIIASFFGGMVALFAPCCVSVLLPVYIGSVFSRKGKVIKMTLVYFSGIAAVLVPIGLGAAFLADFFRDFHTETYIIGGMMMAVIGVMSLAGKGMSMLPKRFQPKLNPGGISGKSVFALGIFSGAATSCCAPVLAGAMTLAVLSGAFIKAIIVIFAYVLGMTFPLFVLALIWDKSKIQNSKIIKGKIIEFNFAGRRFYVHTTNLAAGVIFLGIGLMLIYLALSGNMFWAPEAQTALGGTLTVFSTKIVKIAQKIPDYLWGSVLVIFFGYILSLAIKKKKNEE